MVALDHTEHTEEHISDEEAARRIQKGDIEVFGILLDRYEQSFSRYGKKFFIAEKKISRTLFRMCLSVHMKTYKF